MVNILIFGLDKYTEKCFFSFLRVSNEKLFVTTLERTGNKEPYHVVHNIKNSTATWLLEYKIFSSEFVVCKKTLAIECEKKMDSQPLVLDAPISECGARERGVIK